MDQKKIEKLTNIKNYLENDDITGLNKYIERIKPTVKDDEDFTDIFEEVKSKNYDQALFLTEEIIFDTNEEDYADDFDKLDLDDFEDKDGLILEDPIDDLEDFSGGDFDDLTFDEDKDVDYF
ncbi:MAG: hypothetical protein K0B08_07140 [Bacteroidales bacterium]|nr:hypothetical protein [Bacteroidales bacterium]